MCEEDSISVYEESLYSLVEENISCPNDDQIKMIRGFWDQEDWQSILNKFNTEGSCWYVWWIDGVLAYAKHCQACHV